MILAGIGVEVLMPLAILTGTADRAAGLVMAGYCMVTAIMWKQFWTPGDFWHRGDSKARDLFWDFLKNFSLAGGFLLLAVGGAWQPGRVPHPAACVVPPLHAAGPVMSDPGSSPGPKPSVPYWHVWTDEQGVSTSAAASCPAST